MGVLRNDTDKSSAEVVYRGHPVQGRSAALLVWVNLEFKRWMPLRDSLICLAPRVCVMPAFSIPGHPEAHFCMFFESRRICGIFQHQLL